MDQSTPGDWHFAGRHADRTSNAEMPWNSLNQLDNLDMPWYAMVGPTPVDINPSIGSVVLITPALADLTPRRPTQEIDNSRHSDLTASRYPLSCVDDFSPTHCP